LHRSGERRSSPFPGRTCPATSVRGVPRAVKPFGNERAKAIGPGEPANDTGSGPLRPDGRSPARPEADPGVRHRARERHRFERTGEGIPVSARLRRWSRSGPPSDRWRAGPSPPSPDGPPDALRCPKDPVARRGMVRHRFEELAERTWGVRLPGPGVPAGRYDRGGPTGGHGAKGTAAPDGAAQAPQRSQCGSCAKPCVWCRHACGRSVRRENDPTDRFLILLTLRPRP
jgi:hypothetical protein